MDAALTIESMTYGDTGIARTPEGKAVFVSAAAPGDVVKVRITSEKPSFANAEIVEIVQPGPGRISPICPFAAECGGCGWSHLSYPTQLEAKRANVVSALTRIGHMEAQVAEDLVAPCVGSKREMGYRNKLELGVTTGSDGLPQVGFFRPGSHEPVTPDRCPIAVRGLERAPKALRGALRYLQGRNGGDLGLFRIGVRGSVRTRDIEVALWTTPGPFPRSAAAKVIGDALHATSIVRVMAEEGKARKIKGVEALYGKGCWEEDLSSCRFKVSAPSFFQVNTAQAEHLVELAVGGLDVHEGDLVADLYSGVGTFSLPLARLGAEVVAVESAASSVRDLRRNADLNQVFVDVVGGDSAREIAELEDLDSLIVDPPRNGLDKSVPASIAATGVKKAAYVSCNPTTLARDLVRFAEVGFTPTRITPVDLFPQTHHVETVTILKKAD